MNVDKSQLNEAQLLSSTRRDREMKLKRASRNGKAMHEAVNTHVEEAQSSPSLVFPIRHADLRVDETCLSPQAADAFQAVCPMGSRHRSEPKCYFCPGFALEFFVQFSTAW